MLYTVYFADTTTRAIKRNVGRDRFEVKHEITDGRENEEKRAYEKR